MSRASQIPSRAVVVWLWLCTGLLLAMIVIGGITRLTGSGLSIVRWEPIVGALPPHDADQWERVFALYRETPQYAQVNAGMTVEQFKGIFWWEYFHRLLGRSIGMVVGLPLLFFWLRKQIEGRRALTLLGIFCLGGLQGLLGWYMVQSGLINVPQVSHYRLAAHLGLGFLIFALVFWQARSAVAANRGVQPQDAPALRRAALSLTALATITVLSGALVAGLRAGHAFPTFPKIAGAWIPPGLLAAQPWWKNLLDSPITVNFQHRVLATLVFGCALALFLWARKQAAPLVVRRATGWLLGAVSLQAALGISTLLLHVPTALAAAHQGNAALVIAACLNVVFVTSPARASVTDEVPARAAASAT